MRWGLGLLVARIRGLHLGHEGGGVSERVGTMQEVLGPRLGEGLAAASGAEEGVCELDSVAKAQFWVACSPVSSGQGRKWKGVQIRRWIAQW